MAVQGKEITRDTVAIVDYINKIKTRIYNYINLDYDRYSYNVEDCNNVFGDIRGAFSSVNNSSVPTVEDVATNESVINRTAIILPKNVIDLFNRFMKQYTRSRTITLVHRYGNNTNGGTVTYSEKTVGTYKGFMSTITSTIGGKWATGTTQPPYRETDLNSIAYSKASARQLLTSKLINAENYNNFFDDMYAEWKRLTDSTGIRMEYTTCHTNCHSSCHGSRSRR